MDEHLQYITLKHLERVKAALDANNMETTIAATAADVVPILEKMIPTGASVSNGGSITLDEAGVRTLLRSGKYNYLDRDAEGANKSEMHLAAFAADVYCTSVNAVTEDGELYAIDGTGNRVAAIAYGPATLIVIAGRNKIVKDIEAARTRNAEVAAPANCHRLGLKTPCVNTGVCTPQAEGHHICGIELVLRRQMPKNRIKVILVNEELGY